MEKERVLLKELRESKNFCLSSNIEEHVNDLETQYSKNSYVAIIADEDITQTNDVLTPELPKEQGVCIIMQTYAEAFHTITCTL